MNTRRENIGGGRAASRTQRERVCLYAGTLLLPALLFISSSGCWSGSLRNHAQHTDLTLLSIEELMDVQYITIAKKPQKLFETPAAAHVLTAEDVERAGATNVPDALRMIPGLQVAQHNANSWAVTVRGFSGLSRGISGQFANKLLVLNDGRSVYTPLFSGVLWETQDVLLEDIERVEVIRGPGAALWGANAVNGVINIISKHAEDTQGAHLTVGSGNEQRAFGRLRYGGMLNDFSYYRFYGSFLSNDNSVDKKGDPVHDGWHVFRSGFRLDSQPNRNTSLTLQGDLYDGRVDQTYDIITAPQAPYRENLDFTNRVSGGNLLGRWTQRLARDSELSLQLYYDRINRKEAVVRGNINTFDLDLQHFFRLGTRNEIIWGAGYRLIHDHFDSTFSFSLRPGSRSFDVINAFVQDEVTVVPERLRLTLGSKFEHNDFTQFEIQPNARLLWTAAEGHAVWAAVSRAVRTPSRGENDARIVLQAADEDPIPNLIVEYGNRNLKSETLLAVEFGYRFRPHPDFSVDLATFYNRYDNLQTDEDEGAVLDSSGGTVKFLLPLRRANNMSGRTFGFELTSDWQPAPRIRFKAAYAFFKMHLDLENGGRDVFAKGQAGQSPRHQLFVQPIFELNQRTELDLSARFVDELSSLGIPSYFTLDFRVAWRAQPGVVFSLIGRNLLDAHHPENSEILSTEDPRIKSGTRSGEIQRSLLVKTSIEF